MALPLASRHTGQKRSLISQLVNILHTQWLEIPDLCRNGSIKQASHARPYSLTHGLIVPGGKLPNTAHKYNFGQLRFWPDPNFARICQQPGNHSAACRADWQNVVYRSYYMWAGDLSDASLRCNRLIPLLGLSTMEEGLQPEMSQLTSSTRPVFTVPTTFSTSFLLGQNSQSWGPPVGPTTGSQLRRLWSGRPSETCRPVSPGPPV